MPSDAVKYNDSLIAIQDKVGERDDVFQNSHDSTPEYIQACYNDLLGQVNTSLTQTEKMGPLGDYDDFRKACLEFLGTYKGVIETEYKGIMDIVIKPDSLITVEEDSVNMELYDRAIDKMDAAISKMVSVQEEFARKFNFQILNSEAE